MDISDKRKQVAAQCRVVAHLASVLAQVHSDLADIHEAGPSGADEVLDLRGRWTAERMEVLGDILNGMDAVTTEDAWVNPIFKEAHRLWPTQQIEDATPPAEAAP